MALSILAVFAQVSKPLGDASVKKNVKDKGTYSKMRCSIKGDSASQYKTAPLDGRSAA